MKRFVPIVLLLGLCVSGEVFAQARFAAGEASVLPGTGGALPPYPLILADTKPVPTLGPTVPLPVMAPELALAIYQRRSAQQAAALSSYSAVTVVRAELPESAQQGEYELQRRFEAPHTLQFTPVRYSEMGS